jgi:hypothetical protein
MNKLYLRILPIPKIHWRSIDLRRWYYVWIDNELCKWWVIEGELDELRDRYDDIRFKLIPLWKTIIR